MRAKLKVIDDGNGNGTGRGGGGKVGRPGVAIKTSLRPGSGTRPSTIYFLAGNQNIFSTNVWNFNLITSKFSMMLISKVRVIYL